MNLAGSLGGMVGGYFENQYQRQRDKMEKLQGQSALSAAVRNRMLTDMQARLGQRRAEEGAAESGVYDPSEPLNVGVQAVNRVKEENSIRQAAASEQENYASKQMSALKKAIGTRRQHYYANMGLHLLGAGYGAYNMWPQSTFDPAMLAAQSHSQATGIPANAFNFK